MEETFIVGMGEIRIAQGEAEALVALDLGSCIALCMYDGLCRVAGMAHIVLPDSQGIAVETPGKFADTAVPALLAEMRRFGARNEHLEVVVVGGAQLFAVRNIPARLEIGPRNAAAIRQVLERHHLHVSAQDVGGGSGRTVRLSAADGRVRVRTLGRGERDLAGPDTPAARQTPGAA